METNDRAMLEQSAEMVMETVSMVTRTIKNEMRKRRPAELSMQQFRALGIIQRHPGATLSLVAGHLGLTTASASKLIHALVNQRLVTRVDSTVDRRRVALGVTNVGQRALESARVAALGRLAETLQALDESDRSAVMRAMEVLRQMLIQEA
ncbi:MAG: MarR family transcriptional regulator [Armatimonadota bacterium]|nr:MarR family transcriptional regulator [Armatimonadota bacterium]